MTIDDQLAQLERERTDRLNLLDMQKGVDAYAAHTDMIGERIAVIRGATTALADVEPRLASDATYRDVMTSLRKVLCDELAALPTRIRDGKDLGTQHNLRLSIIAIDQGLAHVDGTGSTLETLRLGSLMRDAGVSWRGSLSEVERRITNLTKRRAEAQARLDEALLDDAGRERRAAEDKARAEALNALPQRKTRGDGSQYDRYPDGRVVEVQP